MSYDWSRFEQTMKIKASVEDIYNAWTTQKGLESWFLRMAEFTRNGAVIAYDISIAEGDTYQWRWHGYPDSVTETGKVLEANGTDKLSFVFGEAGIVTVEIKDVGEGVTEMSIAQTEIPTTEEGKQNYHVGCSTGWTFYRCNMKSILEGGIDIRNKGNDNDMND